MAEQCREQAQLDQVWFVPSAISPLKQHGATATDRQRCEMIEFAIAGHESFFLSKMELERGDTSYTVDTLTQIRQDHPDDELFFLMGGDSLNTMDLWKQPADILQLALPLIVNRPGEGKVDYSKLSKYVDADRLAEIEKLAIESPLIDISSSNIRQRIGEGRSVRYQLPRSVEKYIQTQPLYGCRTS